MINLKIAMSEQNIRMMSYGQTAFDEIWDLTHFGLVTPYGDRDLGQHYLR